MIIKIAKQFIKFIGLSGIGWLIDMFIYMILTYALKGNVFYNNIISSLCGATFTFLLSTRIVFEANHKIPLIFKYVIFIIYQLLLIFTVSRLLTIINTFINNNVDVDVIVKSSAVISKIIITPITMSLNFIISKTLIEKI